MIIKYDEKNVIRTSETNTDTLNLLCRGEIENELYKNIN